MAQAVHDLAVSHPSVEYVAPAIAEEWRIAALANELDAAICVWVNLPLTARRTHKCSAHIAALEARLASFQPQNTS